MEFDGLKLSYAAMVQSVMALGVSFEDAKRANEVLSAFCKHLVEGSNALPTEKEDMKDQIDILKSIQDAEIHDLYKK